MIRTVRKVFAGMFNPTVRLTGDILETLFCDGEGIINGRRLLKCEWMLMILLLLSIINCCF